MRRKTRRDPPPDTAARPPAELALLPIGAGAGGVTDFGALFETLAV